MTLVNLVTLVVCSQAVVSMHAQYATSVHLFAGGKVLVLNRSTDLVSLTTTYTGASHREDFYVKIYEHNPRTNTVCLAICC